MSATRADRRRDEPPSVLSVSQHVLQGTLDTQVQADIAYVTDAHIRFHLGPVFFVLKGREAALSMRDLIDKLAPIIDELYPDLDAELKRQRREVLRRAALRAPEPGPRQRHRTSRHHRRAPRRPRRHHVTPAVPGPGNCHPRPGPQNRRTTDGTDGP